MLLLLCCCVGVGAQVAQSFSPRLKRGMASGDRQQLMEVRRQAAAMMTMVYQQLRRVQPSLREQLLSSCYSCVEAIADADTALGDDEAAAGSLGKCLKAAAAVTPGSDLHVIVASKLEEVVGRLHGEGSLQQQQAWQACVEAHVARYGQLDQARLRRLAELNRTLYV